jgi:hypothetical protein
VGACIYPAREGDENIQCASLEDIEIFEGFLHDMEVGCGIFSAREVDTS